ncbi:MAG: aminoacetone oxidase family FAD-binding enzyme [Chthonomonadales bacterium]
MTEQITPSPRRVLVIGAGAAGILAAWRAASLGARVTLLEKNDRIGIKILISGGGKCNITHDGPMKDLLHAFRPNEAKFIRPACYRFLNSAVVEMLTSKGLEVYTRPDGRIFPTHGNAKDVVRILGDYLDEAGVTTCLNAPVSELFFEEDKLTGALSAGRFYRADRVIVSVGGCSYPGTGATGDGWPWAKEVGHTILKVRAALAPIFTDPVPPDGWSGVSIRDCVFKARLKGKEIVRWSGDLLFTHRGVSGPCALGISREVAENQQFGSLMLEIDLLPDMPYEAVSKMLKEWCARNPKRRIDAFVQPLLPNKFVPEILRIAECSGETMGAYLPQKQRNRLVETLKAWQIGRAEHVPLEKGEVVAGGIALDEVDPQTMRSLKCPELLLCGEILDIAGPVGGYNLQAAFSTGYVAGETAAIG